MSQYDANELVFISNTVGVCPVAMGWFRINSKLWRRFEKKYMKIFVGNLPYQATEDEVMSAFQAFGDVESVRIITDRRSGRSKGFGFVEMPDSEQANAAMQALNGSELGGRNLTVNEANERPPRRDGGGRRGGGYGGGRNRY